MLALTTIANATSESPACSGEACVASSAPSAIEQERGENRGRDREDDGHHCERAVIARPDQPFLPPPHRRPLAASVFGMVVAEDVQRAVDEEANDLLAGRHAGALAHSRFATSGAM